MITHIQMKNFKSWQDSGKVELAPLTGFFGTNSSGKSSLLQMLLLLKQTIGTEEVLFFGDENSLVNLGNFREVIHGHKEEELLELEFKWKTGTPFTIEARFENSRGSYEEISVTTDSVTFNPSILWKDGKLVVEDNPYRVKYGNQESVVFEGTYSNKIYGEAFWADSQSRPINQLSSEFEKLFSSVYYLGPTRVHPKRLYHWEGTHPREVNLWGNKAIDALLSAGVRKLKSSTKEDGVLIEYRISKWLQKMELAHSFQLIPTGSLDDKNYEVRIQKSPNSAEVTLADLGHGVADLFPLLVHCYYVPPGSTLILEQPGVHLHPMAQAQLADLFLDVIAERNLQILVESHSEHLLTRLQRRIAEEKIAADQTALYFCHNDAGVSNIKWLEIDEFGNIANWPKNFFGNEMGDLFAMTKAQRKRQKRAEG